MLTGSEPDAIARPRRRVWFAALCGALAAGLGWGCLSELPRGTSCGDGWWDRGFEQCDPSSLDRGYLSACREQGFDKDATCDPVTCELRASERDCERCGDGVASGDEPCDGEDLRDASCPSGIDAVRCTDACSLDYDLCPAVCGDGIINGGEECEPERSCTDDGDCQPGYRCNPQFGWCTIDGGFEANVDCAAYDTLAIGAGGKPYTSGTVESCTEACLFGRNDCGFCGNGQLDDEYTDWVVPTGDWATFPAEVCDGDLARTDLLEDHCRFCVHEPINADVVVLCEFECNDHCNGFAPPDDVASQDPGCCLAKGSPCPTLGTDGVPDMPCCSWLEHPRELDDQTCVSSQTNQVPDICP